jgi:hypothetical protein
MLTAVGSILLRPSGVSTTVKLVDILKQDTQERFEYSGDGNSLSVGLKPGIVPSGPAPPNLAALTQGGKDKNNKRNKNRKAPGGSDFAGNYNNNQGKRRGANPYGGSRIFRGSQQNAVPRNMGGYNQGANQMPDRGRNIRGGGGAAGGGGGGGGRGRNNIPGGMMRNNNERHMNQNNQNHMAPNNQMQQRDSRPVNNHMTQVHMAQVQGNQMAHVMNHAVPNQFLMGHMAPMQTHSRFISIDVECAATGRGHCDRAPCRIAAVDAHERVLLDVVVHVPNLYNPLFVLTGLTDVQISMGMPLRDALAQLRSFCGPDVVVVGQAIQNDINWLGLVRGQDYRDLVDLAEAFACDVGKKMVKHSLRNTAFGLLGVQMSPDFHNPVEDALISMRLFNK